MIQVSRAQFCPPTLAARTSSSPARRAHRALRFAFLHVLKVLCCCPLELSGRCRLSPKQPPDPLCLAASASQPTRSQARPLGGLTGSSPRGAHRPHPVPATRTRPERGECARFDRLTPPSRPSGDPVWSPPRQTSVIKVSIGLSPERGLSTSQAGQQGREKVRGWSFDAIGPVDARKLVATRDSSTPPRSINTSVGHMPFAPN